jgi:Tol biopolymer transport system component
MKATKFVLLTGLLCAALSAGYLGEQTQKDKAEVALQAAIKTETVDGDLKSAIELYKAIAGMPDADRTTVATALLRMGQCHEKLGKTHTQEALKAYEQVVREYGDQSEIAKLAREKLSLLERARAMVEKEDQGIKMTEVPIDPEKYYYGFISPDAKKLAYVSMDRDIWIMDISSGKEFQLTQTEAREIWCGWSPDSQKIALLEGYGNMLVVSAQGGTPKILIEVDEDFYKENGGYQPTSWSSDSQKIYCWFSKKGLFAIPVSGGDWEAVYEYTRPEQAKTFYRLLLSPNEKFLLYSDTSGNKDIYLMPAGGGEPAQITHHPGRDTAVNWSYDSRWLLFNSDRAGNVEPWIIGISPEGKRKGEPFQVPFLTALTPAGPLLTSWAKEGKIGLPFLGGISNLFMANADGSEEIQLTKMEWKDSGPIWSPDGKYIVYWSSRKDMYGIWILPVQGGEPKNISAQLKARGGVRNYADYAWHPDSRSVSCVVDQDGPAHRRTPGMWTIDIESGLVTKIPFNYTGYIRHLDWSPDGKWIAFTYIGANEPNDMKDSELLFYNIYIMSPSGGEPIRVTRPKEEGLSFSSLRWSPDGRRIAMASYDGRIWTVGIE